jgi:hypothetical protein
MTILASNLISAYLPIGFTGSQGSQGLSGTSSGFPYLFSTSTANSDPGSGYFGFNSTVSGSVTAMYISKLDASLLVDRSGALLLLDDTPGTSRATIYIPGFETGFGVSINVTGDITDNGTWLTIPVSWTSGGVPTIQNQQRNVIGIRNGVQGIQGITGAIGFTGSQGIQGITGAIGFTGSQGIQGIIGPVGFTGSQGIQGITGSIGFTGSQGIQGRQGITGFTGFTGSQGIQGIQGIIGTGFTGSQGIQGIQGASGSGGGAAGRSIILSIVFG